MVFRVPRRLSLMSLLVVVTATAGFFAYVNHNRSTGCRALVHALRSVKERSHSDVRPTRLGSTTAESSGVMDIVFLNAGIADQDSQSAVETKHRNELLEPSTLWDQLMGNDESPVHKISFQGAELSHEVIRQLDRNQAHESIESLTFRNCEIPTDANPFFRDWQHLKRVHLENTVVPKAWCQAIAVETKIERLIVIGDCGALTLGGLNEFLSPQSRISKIHIGNGRTTKGELELARSLAPTCEIHAVALPGGPFLQEPILLSESAPVETSKMKDLFNRLERGIAELNGVNKFNPPASQEQIAKLESGLGVPLPADFRAYLEVHNGQPSSSDELVSMEKLLTVDEILAHYSEWQHYGEPEEAVEYDFNALYDSWVNPNVIPVGTSEDHVIGINVITGKLIYWYSEQRNLDPRADSFSGYVEMILNRVEAGEVECGPEDTGGYIRVYLQ